MELRLYYTNPSIYWVEYAIKMKIARAFISELNSILIFGQNKWRYGVLQTLAGATDGDPVLQLN